MANSQITILNESIPIFIREGLDDCGDKRCENHSPDIVVRKFKLDNPVFELQKTYHSDISEDGDGSGKMYIYVRFKNISKQLVKGFYIHLYRNHLGLCNVPGDWSPYELKTEDNKPVYIESLEPEEIGATPAFIYDSNLIGIHPNCFVAVATYEKNPDYSFIDTYEKYITWINQANVAARNVCVRPRSTHKRVDICYFKNPNKESAEMMGFYVKVLRNTASGIRYGIIEENLKIEESKTCIVNDEETNYIFHPVRIPAGYSGELQVWYEAYENDDVDIDISLWEIPRVQSSALLNQYGIDLGKELDSIIETSDTSLKPMRALLLGGCRLKSEF